MAKPPFPHMGPRDVEIFAAYALTEDAKRFIRWDFDVRVAPGRCPPTIVDPAHRRMALALSQLRIDAVGWEGNWPTLFEVKPLAHLSAFGQIMAYSIFWERERGSTAKRAIITDECNDDMRFLYGVMGIELHCVEPASIVQISEAVKRLRPLSPPNALRDPFRA